MCRIVRLLSREFFQLASSHGLYDNSSVGTFRRFRHVDAFQYFCKDTYGVEVARVWLLTVFILLAEDAEYTVLRFLYFSGKCQTLGPSRYDGCYYGGEHDEVACAKNRVFSRVVPLQQYRDVSLVVCYHLEL